MQMRTMCTTPCFLLTNHHDQVRMTILTYFLVLSSCSGLARLVQHRPVAEDGRTTSTTHMPCMRSDGKGAQRLRVR